MAKKVINIYLTGDQLIVSTPEVKYIYTLKYACEVLLASGLVFNHKTTNISKINFGNFSIVSEQDSMSSEISTNIKLEYYKDIEKKYNKIKTFINAAKNDIHLIKIIQQLKKRNII